VRTATIFLTAGGIEPVLPLEKLTRSVPLPGLTPLAAGLAEGAHAHHADFSASASACSSH
jgi:hypothetical protein